MLYEFERRKEARGGAAGRGVLLSFKLTPSSIRPNSDGVIVFQSSWGLDCSGVVMNYDCHRNTEIFNEFTDLGLIEFEYQYFVASQGASLDAGRDVTISAENSVK